MATIAVLTAPAPMARAPRPTWLVWVARDGDPSGAGLIVGTGPTRDDAIFAALLTLDDWTDCLRQTLLAQLPVTNDSGRRPAG